jgi:hypothetical protein
MQFSVYDFVLYRFKVEDRTLYHQRAPLCILCRTRALSSYIVYVNSTSLNYMYFVLEFAGTPMFSPDRAIPVYRRNVLGRPPLSDTLKFDL